MGPAIDAGARVRQDRVERRWELTGPIADEEPEPSGTVAGIHDEVTASTAGSGRSGVGELCQRGAGALLVGLLGRGSAQDCGQCGHKRRDLLASG